MQIAPRKVVSFAYVLKGSDGELLDNSEDNEPLTYLHGASQIIPGLEKALEGLAVGDERDIVVPPEEAYGERDPQGVFNVPRAAFPADAPLTAGGSLVGEDEDGNTVEVRIVSIGEEQVEVDANHPLAGATLHYHVAIKTVRDATPKELMQGHHDEIGVTLT